MDAQNIEKLNQLISRKDMTGNEKVEWLINFTENYQALQLQQTGVMRWVSVKESLPLNDDEVLIFTINRDIVQAYLKDGKWKGSCMVTDNMNDGFVNDRVICVQGSHFDFVTHWMSLPTPPIA